VNRRRITSGVESDGCCFATRSSRSSSTFFFSMWGSGAATAGAPSSMIPPRFRDRWVALRAHRRHDRISHSLTTTGSRHVHGWPPKFEIESASDNAATNRAIAKFLLCVALSELRSEGIIIGYAIRRGKIL